jgi:two-component system sensor histidine kinase KdpD
MTSAPVRKLLPWVTWLGLLAVLTVGFVALRDSIDRMHVALAFLIITLAGSATGGRPLGRTLAVLAYLDFHFFFIAHFDSLALSKPVDALVLIGFLLTALIAEHLVTQARAQAEEARRRTDEVESLARIGAETLSAGRAEDAVRSITEVIRTSLGVDGCTVIPAGDDDPDIPAPADDPRVVQLALVAHGHRAGILRLTNATPIDLSIEQRRFLDVLSYYAALAIERVRLVAEVERSEALQKAEALRESLVAGLSHDLRTPLTAIKALANRMDARNVPEAAAIEREADRLDRLASDLLDLSRLNAGALPIRAELNTAADLVGAALQRRQPEHRAGRVRVVPFDDGEGDPLTGVFDFVQSLRILENLLENALKYTPPGSPVELSVRREGRALEFHVADRGPGISPAERERVFEPFYRVPGVPADTGGTGLGLAIARRLAREQGGDVRHHPRDGGGSDFIFSLPLAPAADAGEARTALALKSR